MGWRLGKAFLGPPHRRLVAVVRAILRGRVLCMCSFHWEILCLPIISGVVLSRPVVSQPWLSKAVPLQQPQIFSASS